MNSVDLYAKDIKQSAGRACGEVGGRSRYSIIVKRGIVSGVVGGISHSITRSFYFNPLYHLSGLASALIDRILDNYSTYKAVELMEDKRFFEYGLNDFFREAGLLLPNHPTKKDMTRKSNSFAEVSVLALSALFPPIGYGLLASTHILYKNNSRVFRKIKKSLEIGDQVKTKIDAGIPEQEIREWIKNLS